VAELRTFSGSRNRRREQEDDGADEEAPPSSAPNHAHGSADPRGCRPVEPRGLPLLRIRPGPFDGMHMWGGVALAVLFWVVAVSAIRARPRLGSTSTSSSPSSSSSSLLVAHPLCIQVHFTSSWFSTRTPGSPILRAFYSVGAVAGAAGLVLSILVLFANLYANVSAMLGMLERTGHVHSSTAAAAAMPATTASSSATSTEAMETEAARAASPSIMAAGQLTPLLPGINLPIEHAWYLFAAAAVSLIVHEAGHALAARADGIKVTGFGCFLALVMPGAYVNLDEDIIDFVPARKRLRVFAAGPYHNGLLSLLCEATRRLLPLLLLPAYTRLGERGVAVTSVVKDSPLSVTVSLPLSLSPSPLFSSLLSPLSSLLSPLSSLLLFTPLSIFSSCPTFKSPCLGGRQTLD